MREFWLFLEPDLPIGSKDEILSACKEHCSGVVVDLKEDIQLARARGLRTISRVEGADIVLCKPDEKELEKYKQSGKNFAIDFSIKTADDLTEVVKLAEYSPSYILLSCENWKIIPLENLIASLYGKVKLLVRASNISEVRTLLETLELGADGVLLRTTRIPDIEAAGKIVKSVKTRRAELEKAEKLTLSSAKITRIKELPIGARVCVDTCDLMKEGEGILVGVQSSGFFLVQAEVIENPHVAPRPFRVNAGPVALYTLLPDGKTKYLSELKAGDNVLIVSRDGNTRPAVVGRVKIEWRPMLLIEAEANGRTIKAILQNAETIHLVTPTGSKSVTELKTGDEVLVYLTGAGGRHFGMLVEEEKVIEA